MADNVFGLPITDATLREMPEYRDKNVITRRDRASVALAMKNAGDKEVSARRYVENLKREWGDGVSTLCLIYNATGDTLYYVTSHDYWGHIGPAVTYPQEIANGQWAAFLHVKTSVTATGSAAALVYRGKNEAGEQCGWMLAWSNPWNRVSWDNKVYTEVQNAGYFENPSVWDKIEKNLDQGALSMTTRSNGCVSKVETASSTSPIFEGLMTLENA